jgi:long-chain acyl-CoA synthetase
MRDFFRQLSRRGAALGDKPAIVAPGCTYSYRSLLNRIRDGAEWARGLPARVGLLSGKTADSLVADLALSFAGKELVPLPAFFSDSQLAHIIRTARLTHAVSDSVWGDRASRLGLTTSELGALAASGSEPAAEARRIIFTSGSTGEPKGVRLSSRQVLASATAIAQATDASVADRYLSVLPNALLLEQIAGVYVPFLVGASVHLPPASFGGPNAASIASIAEETRPTVTVLVPELLVAWLNELESLSQFGPPSLRYIAVGGAPVPDRLASDAWRRGLPIHEGYGLSECCSVVSVNRTNHRGPGTTGQPLAGVQVTIEQGEIIVSGPTVMDGYLTEPDTSGVWATGDLGSFDPHGRLVVQGRKDNIIVTNTGRNVSPEWIEEMVRADRRIKRCILVEQEGELVSVITPVDESITACTPALHQILVHASGAAPEYAKPRRCLVLSDQEVRDLDLVTPLGRPRRSAIRSVVAERRHFLSGRLI